MNTQTSLAALFRSVTSQARYLLAVLLLLGAVPSLAQSVLDGFDPGANGVVYSLVVQADGKVLVGGDFTQIGGQARNYLARLNPDGSLDAGFDPGANGGGIRSLAMQADGKVLVGGHFTQIGGQPRNRLARLNPDGSLDTGFDPDASGAVYSLAVQVDGKVLVGGTFTQIGGQTRNFLARLNPDGSLDDDFDPGTNNWVLSLAVQADGKVLVGGYFTHLGGQPRNRLARLSVPEAALQRLSVSLDRSRLTWQRSGAGPELEQVWFEQSADALTYTPLGEAERSAGGWALNLPVALLQNQSLWLRARGISRGGYNTGTGSLHESVLWFHVRNVHDVTLTATGNGTATPPTQTVNDGEEASFTLTPDANHHATATGDTCTPVDSGAGIWTAANITADCVVTAAFAIDQYTVTFVDWNVDVLEVQQVDHGSAASAPTDPTRVGYTFTGWDVPFGNVTSNLTVTAQYTINQYSVSASANSANGSIAPPMQTVDHGNAASFTVTPAAGYHALLSGDACAPADNGDGTWAATNIITDCAVTATFTQNTAAAIAVQSGDAQSASVLVPFADALAVRVADAADVPLQGIAVNFAVPDSGAGAVLSATTAITDASGIAHITATANAIAGGYVVEARVAGIAAPASFALENMPLAAALALTVSPQTLPPGGTATLTATVTGEGPLIPGGTVDFYVGDIVVCAAVPVDAGGIATCQAGPFPSGSHDVSARYSGDAAHEAAASIAGVGLLVGANAPVWVPMDSPWALTLLIALLSLVGFGAARIRRVRP